MNKERGLGLPKDDITRAKFHYPSETLGKSNVEIQNMLSSGRLRLPRRGTGLITGAADDAQPMSAYKGPPLPKAMGLKWPKLGKKR